jgi:hypothetical protein
MSSYRDAFILRINVRYTRKLVKLQIGKKNVWLDDGNVEKSE